MQGFNANFKQQAMLWIDTARFSSRDAEETRVELVNALQKAAPPRVGFARYVVIWVIVGVDIPTIRRHLADRVYAVTQQGPEPLRVTDMPGETAANANDGDWLGPVTLDRIETSLHPLKRDQRIT